MKRKAWQRGWIRNPSTPLIWGVKYTRVYLWDDVVGFQLTFQFGKLFSEYTSYGARL